ncbi:DUF3558 domain-containing protein [Nocardia macrotermitis]|uniref:DUF3558 domain-containing protein n=1 Tax=Nocardia macrotermitis TaxID=2585198 RepID=A0A7K0DGE9_9NOCA|nr:DUF3558 domain-containing protein [Nocardia macrotermitis]MQY24372.1 hypothetical protein [Nocardia macrotermitis]
MSRRKTAACGTVLAIAALVSSGCDSGGGSTAASDTATSAPTTAAPTTLTAPSLQPPSQDNKYTRTSGRPKVVFDPCTWIPDDALARIGFDPTTRKRAQDMVAEYTFLTCQVETTDQTRTLQLISGNITLAEDKQRYAGKTQPTTINGREAITTTQKTSADECDLDIQTKAGYFEIGVIVETAGRVKGLQPCDHINDIGTTLEPYVGKDN